MERFSKWNDPTQLQNEALGPPEEVTFHFFLVIIVIENLDFTALLVRRDVHHVKSYITCAKQHIAHCLVTLHSSLFLPCGYVLGLLTSHGNKLATTPVPAGGSLQWFLTDDRMQRAKDHRLSVRHTDKMDSNWCSRLLRSS